MGQKFGGKCCFAERKIYMEKRRNILRLYPKKSKQLLFFRQYFQNLLISELYNSYHTKLRKKLLRKPKRPRKCLPLYNIEGQYCHSEAMK